MNRVEFFGVIAGAAGIAAAGYGVGTFHAGLTAKYQIQIVGNELEKIVPPGAGSEVIDKLKDGDAEAATALLREGVTLIKGAPCIAAGQEVELKPGDFFDQCESKAEVFFSGFLNVGGPTHAYFKVNGSKRDVGAGGRVALPQDCELTYLKYKRTDTAKRPVALVARVGCP